MLPKALSLLSGVDVRPLKDPTSLALDGLTLERLPPWMVRHLLSEARLRQVNHVVVSDCSGVTDEQLCMLCMGAPELRSLTCRSCPALYAQGLRAAHLTALTLVECGITDAAATELGRSCPCLRKLALLQCRELRRPSMASATLATLSLQGSAGLEDEAVAALCAGCPELEELDLSECGALACPHLAGGARLRVLRLEMCGGLGADSLQALLGPQQRLQELSLAHCRQSALGGSPPAWPPSLRRLDCAGCAWLDDGAVSVLGEACPGLEELSLAGCGHLVAPSLGGAALATLDLRNCELLGAAALHGALRRSPRLRSLDMRGCASVARLEDVPPAVLVQLSLRAEPALEALFCSEAARAEQALADEAEPEG